jgi:hypothetical protein
MSFIICSLHPTQLCDQIEEDETVTDENEYKILVCKSEGEDCLGELEIYGRIILK